MGERPGDEKRKRGACYNHGKKKAVFRAMEDLDASMTRLVLASQALARMYEQGAELETVRVKVDEVHACITHIRAIINSALDSAIALDLEQQDREAAEQERKGQG